MFKKAFIISIVLFSLMTFSTHALSTSIRVTSPNGGETWNSGTTQTIWWIYAGSLGSKVKIELLKGGVANRTITSSASIGKSGSGSHNWKIPSNQASGNDYEVRITSTSNTSYTDTSDNNFSISTPSADNTVVGTWEIDGTMRVTVSIPGYGSETEIVNFYDKFIFSPDGHFEMIGVDGTWKQTKKNFTAILEPPSVEDFFEDYFGDYGLDVSVDVTKVTLTGSLQKNDSIKGKLAINMDIYIYGADLEGNVKVSGSFTGIRTGEVLSLEEGDSSSPSHSLVEIVGRKLHKAIQAYGTMQLR
jgi:hypothetical protein